MRPPHFLFTLLLSFALSTQAFAQSAEITPPDFRDWTVRVGYSLYGVRGDSTVSCIMYGSGFIWVRLPPWALITLTSLSMLAIVGSVWRITRRHDGAA